MEKKYWEYPKYNMGTEVTDEGIEEFKKLVEEHGAANATWNVSNFTHQSHAKTLARKLPEYEFSIDYKARQCFAKRNHN